MSPRFNEGDTHLDLAVGGIAQRNGTTSGIEYDRNVADFICFCECKWYSDISIDVTYDKHRNQLARTIENALCFHRGIDFPSDVHVTIVTPEIFMTRRGPSRLFQYKLKEYDNTDIIIAELSDSCLTKRDGYPDLTTRIRCLKKIHWVSFQSLVKEAPDSALKAPFAKFVEQFDGSARALTTPTVET